MKTCITCYYWVVSVGEYDYSENTLGSDFEMYCGKTHWRLDIYNDFRSTLRKYLQEAETCEDFKMITIKD